MNKKILISLAVICAAAAIAVGATTAFFSDTETSTGNTFTAGSLDLKIDSDCMYNGMECIEGHWGQTGMPCSCNFELTDLTDQTFFNFSDIKPGDNGEDTISIHVYDNPAWVCAEISNLTDLENGCNEPEKAEETGCEADNIGELDNNVEFDIWRDYNCNNIYDENDYYLVQDSPVSTGIWPIADSTTGGGAVLPGDNDYCIGIAWSVDPSVTNLIQSDSFSGDITFTATQERHQPNFRCVPPEIITVVGNKLNFSSTGWGGLSCPGTHPNVVGGGVSQTNVQPWVDPAFSISFVLAKTGATLDGFTYPVFPHYTYPAGEEGIAAHNGGTAQSLYLYAECQAN